MANIFDLRDSSLNAFLFSDVGTEANGSSLTMLSLLARLGKDPWDEAAAWSRKPKDAAIRSLTDSISRMPPNQQVLDDARLTAARLVTLLPNQAAPNAAPRSASSLSPSLATIPKANLYVFVCLALFLAFNLWVTVGSMHDAASTTAIHPVAASTK
jgi:hypothetical protein